MGIATELIAALKMAYDAIESSPEDCMGDASDGEIVWPVRDEVLHNIAKAIKRGEESMTPCKAIIRHGPGHMSKTECYLHGPHEIHEALYGSMMQLARWRGMEATTGFFDEPPYEPDDE